MGGPFRQFPDDKMPLEGNVTEEAIQHRLEQLKTWFDRFLDRLRQSQDSLAKRKIYIHDLSFAEDAAERVNSVYWEVLVETVKRRITPSDGGNHILADRHKIASLTELMIVHEQPIEHRDEKMRAHLNALLAFFCATHIIGNWDGRVIMNLIPSREFQQAHLSWLENIAPSSEKFPIFSNSATWYLVEEIFLLREKFPK
ncbi:MAG: hypothetical protein EG825_14860 [Rhodocyclaceae bacterium]|nr:hypothetical protein [Rhodocyclaceae bacterium]